MTISPTRTNPRGPIRARPPLRVHECFERLVERQPSAPAIIAGSGALSYGELDARANALAHALLAQGVMAEEAVGVFTERSASLPVAFLAVLKAGGACVPMGADLPPQRLANMAAQAGMRFLIALDGLEPPAELLAALAIEPDRARIAVLRPETLSPDTHRPDTPGKPGDLAAILFASGPSGQPKGILLQHDSAVNLAYGHIEAQNIVPTDRLLMAAAPGFILAFRELCLPLLAGAALFPASRALLDDPAALLDAMSRLGVTVAMLTPSYLRSFQGAVPTGLRCLLTTGERPLADEARAYARRLDYWNMQGATEVCGTICLLRVDPNGRGPLSSGKPFANTAVYLLDGDGKEVAEGQVGEVFVVGAGVARGYLHEPEQTAGRFVETSYGRAYRSHDIGRWNGDGELEYLGRVDDLVKVSGQSVSLGEIEQTLMRHSGVTRAAVLQHQGRLIAFVEGGKDASLEEWHGFLSKSLPAYMLPAQVTSLAAMPVDSQGKPARQALLKLAGEARQSLNGGARGGLPQGGVERQIAEVWEQILAVRPIMREDNFYALGGTSLLSILISQQLQARGYSVTPQQILAATTVAALAEKIAAAPELPAAPDAPQGLATSGQEDFWIAWKLGLDDTGSRVTRVLAVRGRVPEPTRWQSAWTRLVARHAALRTAFFTDAGGELLWRSAEAEKSAPAVRFRLDDCDSRNDAREHIAAQCQAPFELTEVPLARAGLVRVVEGGETLFWFTIHHSVADGLSARILQEEIHALLTEDALAPAPNGIAAASHAEQRYLRSGAAERDRNWWRDQLDALIAEARGEAFHEFTTDHRRPAIPSGTSAAPITERLDGATVSALTRLAQSQQAGLHALLLTLLGAEARRRASRQNMIIGSGISIRPPGADRAMGHFVNLLPLVVKANHASLAAEIRAAQATLTESVAHAAFPAGLLYREFRERHPDARAHGRTSLFDISLTANPSRCSGDRGSNFSLAPWQLPEGPAHPAAGLDLAFSYEPVDDSSLELSLLWNPDVYRPETAQAWLRSLAAWARWLADDTGRADAPLPALLPAEARCLERWECGPARPRPPQRFPELFENLASQYPHRPAVIGEGTVQTYTELERKANCIALTLIANGVAREEPVAVLTEASPDLPATVLGIWKAGAVYLPLAVEQPPERLAYMTADSRARILIVLEGHAVPTPLTQAVQTILRSKDWNGNASFSGAQRIALPGTPQDLAYIIYTSGTTGMPKGVTIQHDSLINAALASGELFGLTPEDRVSLAATPGFDASLWELGMALLHGIALVPVSSALRDDPWALKEWYKTHGVTVAFHAPSYLRVSQDKPFEGLRVLLTGGEAANHADAKRDADRLAMWHAYGPTETCIFVCAEQVSANADPARPLPVGRPLPNTRFSIRCENGDPAPPGVLGEVWLGGAGLARGYLNDEELTARQFLETPEGRFYRSGDLGRWTEDGRLELAGRIDHQIKLHGQRVELGEIEHALCSHPAVEDAKVLMDAAANDTRLLQAFVRLRPDARMPAADDWRAYLGDRLPPYMVPASVNSLAAFPLTFAGKIDRDAVLASARQPGNQAKHGPIGEMQTRIAALWADLLGCPVSREDNFFALGGNSLLAITMAHRLSSELGLPVPARELFAAPALRGFAERVTRLLGTSVDPIPASAASDLATEGQREFWVAEQAGLDTRIFNMPLLRRVEGAMPSLERWNQAWSSLVARHDALRTYFGQDAKGRLRRIVTEPRPLGSGGSLESAIQPDLASARTFIRHRQIEPFTMSAFPLWRAGLVAVADSGEHLFWLAMHHSAGDGQSLGTIAKELSALVRGEELPALAGGFAESAAREEAYLARPNFDQDAAYWHDLLAQQPDAAYAEPPLDFPRSLDATTGMHRFETLLGGAAARGLRALAREYESSLHAVMVTILAIEARRRMGRSHILMGTAASVRETAGEEQVIGYYVNMLPVPCHLPEQVSFGAALGETQRALAAGLQHARYPFARMYRDFYSERPHLRHPARYPLFDLAVTENPENRSTATSLRLTRVPGEAYELTDASPTQDMVLIHEAQPDGTLVLEWQVNATLFTRETAASWLEALTGWAVWLATDGGRAREVLPGLLPAEMASLERWEKGAQAARPPVCFDELFERVHDSPGQCDRPAIITQTATTTYGALEQDANAIAHGLLFRGAASGTAVGVLTERSANLPAAVLGIWKAGATYVPLAADLPAERLAFMARDAGVALLIVLDELAVPAPLAVPVFRPEELDPEFRRNHAHRPRRPRRADDAAYIIYTSGSTGRPKGTLIAHDAYVNLVLGAGETIGMTYSDRSLLFASPSFDVALSDLGLPLAFGAALCPVPYEVLCSPNRFRSCLIEWNVSVADLTPSYLRLLDGAELPSLRVLVTGGEPPFPAEVAIYAARHQYFNAYGPTENTITSTMGKLSPEERGFVSSGRPLPNTSVEICDSAGNRLPPGMIGELWLGGAGLARHYVGRPDLSAAAFVETARGRRYRSGDLGRWRPTGELEVIGRVDHQVKLHGIRIELGEIEHALRGHADVAQAVALLDGAADGNQSLWAFVCSRPGRATPAEEDLRDFLSTRLPAYMIPSAVMAVPRIPLSNSGKVDRAALKKLVHRSAPEDESLPQDGLEAGIAGLWSELLGGHPIHRDDNFFALGGHSLLAIAVAHRLEKMLGHPVPARILFAQPTLQGFAREVGQLSEAVSAQSISSDRATVGQRDFWVAQQAGIDNRGFNLALTLALPSGGPGQAETCSTAWAALVARHGALRTRFREDPDGVLRRSVLPGLGAHLEICNQRDMPAARAHIRERQTQPFALEHAPLWRAGLVRVAEELLFWLSLDHAVGDGVSLGVLSEELSILLKGGTLPPSVGNFDETAGREELYLTGPSGQEDARYWRGVLGACSWDEWPLDFPRTLGRANGKGAHSIRIRLDARTADGMREFAKKNDASMHSLMLTMVAGEVRRRTGRAEFFVGTAASTRDSASEARTVGYYVNMLPVLCRVDGRESVEQALQTMHKTLTEALQHARYPFACMHRDLPVPPGRAPVFDFAVTENPAACGVFSCLGYELNPNAPPQDMVLAYESQPDGSLLLHWYVNASIYRKETAEAWIESLVGWAGFLAERKRIPHTAFPALLPAEENLLTAWEHGPALAQPAPGIAAWFAHLAGMQPERPAVITERGEQSYAEIDARSNALAHALVARGVAPQEPVGVFTGRSSALPETVLAIWKAGACYLPLVHDLPSDRLAFVARDAGVRVLVVLDGLEPPVSLAQTACEVFRPESLSEEFLASHRHTPEMAAESAAGSDVACIIYTSGSTGVPKGVMLHHRGLMNLGLGTAAALGTRSSDRSLMMASPGFDLWLADLTSAWTVGAAVVPTERGEVNDIAGIRQKIARLGVTTASMTPSYLRLFEQAEFPGLRVLMTVGEPPHREDVLHYAAHVRYINGYGPTENTAAASYGLITPQAQRLTAGTPMANTSVHIRNNQGEPVPPGAVGEIWLGGTGLALGYLNRPDLTAASFLETNAGRLYRTGDLGRWTHSGELEILGRSDSQVKLRGQRVELGEIQHQLEEHAAVQRAVALVDTQADGAQILWAFVCLRVAATPPSPLEWRDYLANRLPSYMLPAAVIEVAAIPTNTAGKTDRAALLRLVTESAGRGEGTPLGDDKERRIAQIWAEHLKCPVHTREDHFFDLGGNSLRAISVVNQLRREFQCRINDLYEHPRLADFAAVCRRQPEHLRKVIQSAAQHWRTYRQGLADYDAERDAALAAAMRIYEAKNLAYRQHGAGPRRDYGQVLLTGATGYLGAYLLRELLADSDRQVNALVRGSDDQAARARLGEVLLHYFGPEKAAALRDHPRLRVLAGDLRRDDLGLSAAVQDRLADSVQAVFHCAANVKHYGHFGEFHADNVAATERLLKLAAHRSANPADFHLVSTLSVCGDAPEEGFRLFTEYDGVPPVLDDNYYLRSKQEAERVVAASRGELANACIHRVGNVVFAAEGGPLQFNLTENAFFRQLAAFLRLGVVPDDSHLWLCHVDLVARGLVMLAGAPDLNNETHHLENSRRDTVAAFATAAWNVRSCRFGAFLDRLQQAVGEPEMASALNETLENFRLYSGRSPQPRARRLEIVSLRTQALLARLGVGWPPVPPAGQSEMLRRAAQLFAPRSLPMAANRT